MKTLPQSLLASSSRAAFCAVPCNLPPIDPEKLQENAQRFLSKRKPQGGWKKKREKDER